MKFIANPNKLLFAICIGVLGFWVILCAVVISKVEILCVLFAPWIFVPALIGRLTHVRYTIVNKRFVVQYMGKTHEFTFPEVQQIDERTHCDNLGAKSYQLHVFEHVRVDEKLLKIENATFTKWIGEHAELFKIPKNVVL